MAEGAQQAANDKTAVRPFHVNVPEAELTDLRSRINAAKWPKRSAMIRKACPRDDAGLDIHFIHARSDHENALPLIVTHGWPGSVIEQLKIIGPLTNPTAHGASASDASTSTSQPRLRLTSPRRSSPATRRHPACQPTKDAHTSS